MNSTESVRGRIALMAAHCAGMVDLVALPVWVGALIGRYGFDPQQAGALATLFLLGAVLASSALAPQLARVLGRLVPTVGFGVAAAAFALASGAAEFGRMALLHGIAGVATGAALSVTHGTIARSPRPHRLFAIVGTSLGVFAVAFLGITPRLVEAYGGPALFRVFATVMAAAALVAAVAFPLPEGERSSRARAPVAALASVVWFGVAGIAGMSLVQAMTFAFLERVGIDHGFGGAAVAAVLVALGIVNLFPAPLAALFERRLGARSVMLAGPVLQAVIVLVIMNATSYAAYAAAAAVFAAVMIFTHTFAFGLLAKLDTSGRALAATPAMTMIGAACGPILGGTLVKTSGYGSLGLAACAIAAVACACFTRLPVPPSRIASKEVPA